MFGCYSFFDINIFKIILKLKEDACVTEKSCSKDNCVELKHSECQGETQLWTSSKFYNNEKRLKKA